jgi:hypothetical protein
MKKNYYFDEDYISTIDEELSEDINTKKLKINKNVVKRVISTIVLIPTAFATINSFNKIKAGEKNYIESITECTNDEHLVSTDKYFINSNGDLWVSEQDYNDYMSLLTTENNIDTYDYDEKINYYIDKLPDTYVEEYYTPVEGEYWVSKRDYIEYALSCGIDLDSYIVNQKALS